MRFGGIVLLALLTLGACSSDPSPVEPTASSPTVTPTTAAPTMPAQATEDSPEGAAAFVKHYVDVFNYAARTGDVEELSALSSPACEGCQRYIDLYTKTYAAGGYFKDSDWRIRRFQVEMEGERSTIFGRVTSKPGTYRLREGDRESVGNAENSDLTFVVERQSSGWNLVTLELQAS